MRISSLIFCSLFFLQVSCNNHEESKYDGKEIHYKLTTVKSPFLEAKAELVGIVKSQELIAEVQFFNPGTEDIFINDVSMSTSDGLRSLPLNEIAAPVLVAPSKSANLALRFNPYNDVSHYSNKDKKGSFKSSYNLIINYTKAERENLIGLVLPTTLSESEYKIYEQQYKKGLIRFSFDQNSGFSQKQREYLQNFPFISKPAFIDISEQQISISGLSLQLKCIQNKDSVYTELLVINHANFPLIINKDSLDLSYKGDLTNASPQEILLNKVSGPRSENTIIEKGDRVVINFSKYLKYADREKLYLSLKNVFILPNDKPLFCDGVLLKVSLP